MNVENAKKLVGQLERLPDEKFTMNTWIVHGKHEGCGTVACIAGWCSLLNGGPQKYGGGVRDFAAKFLALDDLESEYLFFALWSSKDTSAVTRADAIDQLYRMIEREEAPA